MQPRFFSMILAGCLVLGAGVLPMANATPTHKITGVKIARMGISRLGAGPALAMGKASTMPKPRVKKNPKDEQKYVWVPAGTFMMGCSPGDNECVDAEKPAHQVTLTKGFWLGQTPVTVAAYQFCVKATGKSMPAEPVLMGRPLNPGWKDAKQPMVNLNWFESGDYCTWIGGRLPTDAEWEYSARGGSPNARYGPLDDIAWYADNSGSKRLDTMALKAEDKAKYGGGRKILNQALHDNGNSAHDVGLKKPNAFGLFDILGNVWVWVNDWYEPGYYQHSPSQDPQGPSSGQFRVERGASWDDVPQYQRASFNHWAKPELRDHTLGFRCVWERPK